MAVINCNLSGADAVLHKQQFKYRKVSNIGRAKSQYLNDSHLILQSSLPSPLKQGVKLRMKM